MKDMHKNMLVMVAIAIIISIVCHFYLSEALTFPLLFAAIALWFWVSPFKFTDDDDKQDQ